MDEREAYGRVLDTLHEAALAGVDALGGSLAQLLEATGLGVIHLDPRGRILEANDPARELLRSGEALFDARGLLYAKAPEENVALQALLAEGRSVPEIASATGRAEGTTRTHLKNVFAKHGLSRQADLIRLVLSVLDAPGSCE